MHKYVFGIFLTLSLAFFPFSITDSAKNSSSKLTTARTNGEKTVTAQKEIEKRYAELLRSPEASRYSSPKTRVSFIKKFVRLGPVNPSEVGTFKLDGKFTATQYADFFHGRMSKSGVKFDHYTGYTIAVKQFKNGKCYFPMGTVLLLRYGCSGKYSYCLVVVSDSGRLPLHKNGFPQFDCSRAVSKSLGLYCKKKSNYREGEFMVIHVP